MLGLPRSILALAASLVGMFVMFGGVVLLSYPIAITGGVVMIVGADLSMRFTRWDRDAGDDGVMTVQAALSRTDNDADPAPTPAQMDSADRWRGRIRAILTGVGLFPLLAVMYTATSHLNPALTIGVALAVSGILTLTLLAIPAWGRRHGSRPRAQTPKAITTETGSAAVEVVIPPRRVPWWLTLSVVYLVIFLLLGLVVSIVFRTPGGPLKVLLNQLAWFGLIGLIYAVTIPLGIATRRRRRLARFAPGTIGAAAGTMRGLKQPLQIDIGISSDGVTLRRSGPAATEQTAEPTLIPWTQIASLHITQEFSTGSTLTLTLSTGSTFSWRLWDAGPVIRALGTLVAK